MNPRIGRLRAGLDGLGAVSFLVTDPTNVRWLTGLRSSNAAVLVRPEGVTVATDGRYLEAARALEGSEVVLAGRNLAAWLGEHLAELVEPPIAYEADHLTVAAHEAVARGGAELVPTKSVVKGLRAVKDADELDAVRRSARVLHDALERLAQERFVGRTEAEVAWWIERALREEGAEAAAFDVIVASGPNASAPHHHPGVRTIGARETVIVDLGARVDGYCSDCTRTFATGALGDELLGAYATARAAQEAALAAVRPAAVARDLDAIARREIAQAGYDVLHGLGHGVGLEIHELPVLSDVSEEVLAPGNVVTVEPGVYLPGSGGVRIEDLVIVAESGPEVLTPFTKDLVTLD